MDAPRYIDRPTATRLTGDERFMLASRELPGTQISAFWRWAFSSLSDNTLRGDLMEWAVAHLLGIQLVDRENWTPYDLLAGSTTIQVKQASYLQGWAQKKVSTPRFSKLFVGSRDADTNGSVAAAYQCDWYVFALLETRDAGRWNPLDLDQWLFYIAPQAALNKYKQQSVGVGTLERWAACGDIHRLSAQQLRSSGRQLMSLDPNDAIVMGRELVPPTPESP